jgi:hypothetical protein
MHRERRLRADPVRSTEETWSALIEFMAAAMPSVATSEMRLELAAVTNHVRYLIQTEKLVEQPLTLVAGSLTCDIFLMHGAEAIAEEDGDVPVGAKNATDWMLFLPVPHGAPFTASDIEGLSLAHVKAAEAVKKAEVAALALAAAGSAFIDADELRKAAKSNG